MTGARRAGREVVRELALWLTAGVGLLVFAAAAALVAFGMKPLVFLSGSMEPHIGTGALALTTTTPAPSSRKATSSASSAPTVRA